MNSEQKNKTAFELLRYGLRKRPTGSAGSLRTHDGQIIKALRDPQEVSKYTTVPAEQVTTLLQDDDDVAYAGIDHALNLWLFVTICERCQEEEGTSSWFPRRAAMETGIPLTELQELESDVQDGVNMLRSFS